MGTKMSTKGLAGLALMLVGIVLFAPGLLPGAGQLSTVALLPAAILLTVGTYLVGTDGGGGRPV